jgi:hypothetical protein
MKKIIINFIKTFLYNFNKLKPFVDKRILLNLSKAASSKNINLDPKLPYTWEFKGFSQNSEDGLIEFLASKIIKPNKYFVEIGASNGLENNSSFLAIAKGYSGIMIDGDKKCHLMCKEIMNKHAIGVDCLNLFVDKETVNHLKEKMLYKNPDIFSLDIDGNDYYLAQTILESGIRPKIFIVEYNSSFGPEKSITIKYDKNFVLPKSHDSLLYFGVSYNGWKTFFQKHNYKYVCVDSNGVNAFFIDENEFDKNFTENLVPNSFKENFWNLRKHREGWEKQFKLIKDLEFYQI